MRIVFIGCVDFSRESLKKLFDLKANIVGVITKEESSFNSDFFELSRMAELQEIPYK
jgi:methionyl-tRNA formyltransferase